MIVLALPIMIIVTLLGVRWFGGRASAREPGTGRLSAETE
jgi:hypothetical protein